MENYENKVDGVVECELQVKDIWEMYFAKKFSSEIEADAEKHFVQLAVQIAKEIISEKPRILEQIRRADLLFAIPAQSFQEKDTLPDTILQIHESLGEKNNFVVFALGNCLPGQSDQTESGVKEVVDSHSLENVIYYSHQFTDFERPYLNMSRLRALVTEVLAFMVVASNRKNDVFVSSFDSDVVRNYNGDSGVNPNFINSILQNSQDHPDACIFTGPVFQVSGSNLNEIILAISFVTRLQHHPIHDYNAKSVQSFGEANCTFSLQRYLLANGYNTTVAQRGYYGVDNEGSLLFRNFQNMDPASKIVSLSEVSIITSSRRYIYFEYKQLNNRDRTKRPWDNWGEMGVEHRTGHDFEDFGMDDLEIFKASLTMVFIRGILESVRNIPQKYDIDLLISECGDKQDGLTIERAWRIIFATVVKELYLLIDQLLAHTSLELTNIDIAADVGFNLFSIIKVMITSKYQNDSMFCRILQYPIKIDTKDDIVLMVDDVIEEIAVSLDSLYDMNPGFLFNEVVIDVVEK